MVSVLFAMVFRFCEEKGLKKHYIISANALKHVKNRTFSSFSSATIKLFFICSFYNETDAIGASVKTLRKYLYPILIGCTEIAAMVHCPGAVAAWHFTPRISVEMVTAETTESVYYNYPNGGKLSQLDWNLDSLFRINIGGTIQPTDWMRINLDYAFKIDYGNADMTDYDWFYSFYDWSHRSEHSDTVINKANHFEIGCEFPIMRAAQLLFTGGFGYRIDDWEWEARGGNYIYSSGLGFRDEVGSFPNGEKGITYEHKLTSFFLSLGAEADFDRFAFASRVLYSPETKTDTKDTHHMRDLVFTEDFDDTTMLGIEIGAVYRYNRRINFSLDYTYTKYDKTSGQVVIAGNDISPVLGDTVEGTFKSHETVIALGVSYRFP